MTLTLTLTENKNISEGIVIDESKIFKKKFVSSDPILVVTKGIQRVINVINLSLYEDLIVLDNEHLKILNLFSKG